MRQSLLWWRYVTLGLLVLSSGHMYAIDEAIMYDTTLKIWQVIVGEYPSTNQYVDIFSKYGPMQSIMALPWLGLGKLLALLVSPEFRPFIEQWVITWQGAIVVATTAVLLRWMILQLGYAEAVARLLMVVYAFASMATVYSRTFFSDTTVALWLLCCAVPLCIPVMESYRLRWYITIAGVSTFFAVFTKIAVAPAVCIWGMAIVWQIWHTRDWVKAKYWGMGVVSGMLCFLVWNEVLYGNMFGRVVSAGYGGNSLSTDPWVILQGLHGLYLSWQKSIFVYTPFALIWVIGLWWKRLPHPLYWPNLLVIAVVSVIHAALLDQNGPMWYGGGSWGPRYLISVLPLLILGSAPVWQSWYCTAWRYLRHVVVVLSCLTLVAIGGAMTISMNTYILAQKTLPNYDAPWYNAVIGHWVILTTQLSEDVQSQRVPRVTLQGWSYSEGNINAGETMPRWMGDSAQIRVQTRGGAYPLVRMQIWQCMNPGNHEPTVDIRVDDWYVGAVRACPDRRAQLLLPQGGGTLTLIVAHGVPVPADAYQARWIDTYGVFLRTLEVFHEGTVVPVRTRPFAEEHLPQNDFRLWLNDIRRGTYDWWGYYVWALPAPGVTVWPVVPAVFVLWGGLVEWSRVLLWVRQRVRPV